MEINENILKSFILSTVIVLAFRTMFDMLGWTNGDSELAVGAMIIFTLLLCTYKIIDEIRKLNGSS